jgi:hypothetical protein
MMDGNLHKRSLRLLLARHLDVSPALGDKLPFIERLKLGQGRCLFGTLVFTDSRNPCKAQREA